MTQISCGSVACPKNNQESTGSINLGAADKCWQATYAQTETCELTRVNCIIRWLNRKKEIKVDQMHMLRFSDPFMVRATKRLNLSESHLSSPRSSA